MRIWSEVKLFFSFMTLTVLIYPVFNYLTEWQTPRSARWKTTPAGDLTAVAEPASAEEEITEEEAVISLEYFPVEDAGVKDIISFFGDVRTPTRVHEGVDIKADRGTPVLAAVDGTVKRVKNGGPGGRQIWLSVKGKDLELYYAHLNSERVKEGQEVKAGDVIGTVGNTGNASAASPHLHFCIYTPERVPFDPLPVLKKIGQVKPKAVREKVERITV